MVKELNITEEEYRGIKHPSYSLLKRIDNSGPREILKEFKGDSEPMDFGNLVDCIMLQPDELDNKFYFKAVEKPTAQLLKLADFIVDMCKKEDIPLVNLINDIDSVSRISDELNLFGSVKVPETRIKQFNNDLFWGYLQAVSESENKTIFTSDTLDDAIDAIKILRENDKTAHLFSPAENIDVIDQLKLVGTVAGHEVKGMLDKVIIDHENKMITPYDLKCTDVKQRSFPYIFTKMKYYLQAALYLALVVEWASKEYPDYVVNEFRFIVYSRNDKYPFVWVVSDTWINNGFHGYVDYKGNNIKGITGLLDDYYYYVNNQQFTIEKEFIENSELYLI